MTRLDAARMVEADAKAALTRQLNRLAAEIRDAIADVSCDQPPSVVTLHHRAAAVQEAADIWAAARTVTATEARAEPVPRRRWHAS